MTIRIGIGIDNARYNSIDPAASSFLTAAGITDPTITNAINRLVKNYKGIGDLNTSVDLWTGSKVLYPFVGGTATTHKFNLKDPRDLDTAYRQIFIGGITHSSTGALPNGTNAASNTNFKPNILAQNSARYGYYSRTQYNSTLEVEVGVFNAGNTSGVTIGSSTGGGNAFGRINEAVGTFMSYANTLTQGFFMVRRASSTTQTIWKNGVKQLTATTTSAAPASVNLYLFTQNTNGTLGLYSRKECAFFVAGDTLSDSDTLLEYQIIQQFQTDLSRQV